MALRLPHVAVKTMTLTCKLDTDLYADLTAYAAALEAERGDPIPLPTLMTIIVRDYLQHDPDFMRQRRQGGPTRVRPGSRPPGAARRNGGPGLPGAHADGEDGRA